MVAVVTSTATCTAFREVDETTGEVVPTRVLAVVQAILASWPADPRQRTDAEWAVLRQRLPQGLSNAEVRNRTRQVGKLAETSSGRRATPDRATLPAKQAVLEREHERICARVRGPNHALAWAAARWAVDQAWALGATVIYVEDLAMLEARGRRPGNVQLSGQVRGTVVAAIRHLASKQGIATVTVPARGTSKLCPRCGRVLRHTPAPDRPHERGWRWASCPSCGLAGDRDHAAAEWIVARALLAQAQVRTERKTGQHTVTIAVEGNVPRARRPKRRTRAAQPHITRTTGKPTPRSSRRMPDRRAVPAPAAKVAGKRPAGQAPKTHDHRHAEIGSGPANDRLPCPCRSRRPGAGWGFHHSVTATAVLPMGDYGPATAWPRLPERLNHSGKPRQSETLPEDPS
jgi:Putative transposase DNA-binding domain